VYFTFYWQQTKKLGVSGRGNDTGTMLIPYFGTTIPELETGELRESNSFFQMGAKVRYTIKSNLSN